jgi:ubiquinone/menaquinone biosynthesis C-methylase UbiE
MPHFLQRVFWSLYGRIAWDAVRPPWREGQVQRIVEILRNRQVASEEWVLDAGCGTGDFALALAKAGFRVIGIDYAEGMLAAARAKVTAPVASKVSFQHSDLNRPLEFVDARFHHAINISVLQVAAEPTFTLGELRRVLKPGGTLVLVHVPRPNSCDLPLWDAIRQRTRGLERKTLWRVFLIVAKTWAERVGSTRFWTAEALRAMLVSSRFELQTVDEGPPIVIVARKTESERDLTYRGLD